MREIIKEGRTVEEAVELACRELGVVRDEVELNIDIIDLPKRGFLGLINKPAKVRVCVEEPEPEKPPRKAAPAREERPARQERPQRPQQPRPEQKKEQKPAQKPQPPAPKKEQPAPVPPPKPEAPKEQPKKEQPQPPELKFVSADEIEGKARAAADYVKAVLAEMGVDAGISVAFTENGIVLRLSGEGLGVIIGRRGETLDSLQYLAGLVANREEGDYMRVTIDSGNYREKRERTLERLAQKLSASAIRFGRPSTLEPMNPYERRIIHSTVSKIEGVSSASVGEEPNRRVVITPDKGRPQGANRGGRGGRGGGRDRRPAGGGEGRPPRAGEGRPPRGGDRRDGPRDGRAGGKPPFNRGRENAGASVRPTPTDVDREYAKELEQGFVKPEPSEKPPVQNTAPARTEARKEGEDLPLYGKIDL